AILPVGLLGSVLALLISGIPLSSTAMIGFILVIGITANNAIVLVAFIEQLRKEGKSLYEAVSVGTSLRIQPKLMTAFIAMAGMVPLAIAREEGGEILQPLALTILGGMPVALIATLIVLPVIYLMVHERKIKREERKRNFDV
ncbi:MAG: efflux RND transporter permease subunit, partial [Rugosibacter sp.]